MKAISNELRKILIFTIVILVILFGYYIYISINYLALPEHESFLSELGEGIGGDWFVASLIYLFSNCT